VARSKSTQPTDTELQILRILWDTGGTTARGVHNALASGEQKDTIYSTTVKMLAVMLEKGLVTRDETVTPHVYRGAASRKTTQQRMLRSLIEKVYEGSALSLVMQALSSKEASKEDLAEVRRLIDELESTK
jgi:predicted transcriptional regulator